MWAIKTQIACGGRRLGGRTMGSGERSGLVRRSFGRRHATGIASTWARRRVTVVSDGWQMLGDPTASFLGVPSRIAKGRCEERQCSCVAEPSREARRRAAHQHRQRRGAARGQPSPWRMRHRPFPFPPATTYPRRSGAATTALTCRTCSSRIRIRRCRPSTLRNASAPPRESPAASERHEPTRIMRPDRAVSTRFQMPRFVPESKQLRVLMESP